MFYVVIDVLAWGIGRWARRHRLRMAHLQEQHTLQVQEQREAAEHAVSAERLRIARELHDIVAHSVTIMVLHAAGAKRVVDTDPARAKESLATIEESGQQAMGELRRLLELLRENEGDPPRSGSPLPGLQQVAQTINSVRASGVEVAFEVHGEPRRLDTSVDLAAYRLVQEALTNVTKHRGAGARATVTIDWGVDKLTVAVRGRRRRRGGERVDHGCRRVQGVVVVHRERAGRAAGTDCHRWRRLRRRPRPMRGDSGSPRGCRCRPLPIGAVGSATPARRAAGSSEHRTAAIRPGTPLAWIDP